jgi:hypothetical protein
MSMYKHLTVFYKLSKKGIWMSKHIMYSTSVLLINVLKSEYNDWWSLASGMKASFGMDKISACGWIESRSFVIRCWFTTTMNEADSEIGALQIIMDNLNIQQKTRHKTLETGNKVHNLAYSKMFLSAYYQFNNFHFLINYCQISLFDILHWDSGNRCTCLLQKSIHYWN